MCACVLEHTQRTLIPAPGVITRVREAERKALEDAELDDDDDGDSRRRPSTIYSTHGTILSTRESQYTWVTCAKIVKEEPPPPQKELWEAIEDGDAWDVVRVAPRVRC